MKTSETSWEWNCPPKVAKSCYTWCRVGRTIRWDLEDSLEVVSPWHLGPGRAENRNLLMSGIQRGGLGGFGFRNSSISGKMEVGYSMHVFLLLFVINGICLFFKRWWQGILIEMRFKILKLQPFENCFLKLRIVPFFVLFSTQFS